MFYCHFCKDHRGITSNTLAGLFVSSVGTCELCLTRAPCYDVPTRALTFTRDEQGRPLYATSKSGALIRLRYLPDGGTYAPRQANNDLQRLRVLLETGHDADARALLTERAEVLAGVLEDQDLPDLAARLTQAARSAEADGTLPGTLLAQVTFAAQMLRAAGPGAAGA